MGRLPFDPGRMRDSGRGRDEPLTVSAFARLVEQAVAGAFPSRVTVRGEVSGARHRTHHYFSLKDDGAVIGAVMFASAAKRAPVTPVDGRTVVATGKLEYYAPQGRLSLIVESLKEDGEGSLDARFRALCDRLREKGWFDPAAKKPIPGFPRRVAVLTASGSAALHDVLDTAEQRCPAVELVLVDVPVQGERAAPTIARTIRAVDRNAERLGIDALLVTRGGGSIEDLWCFNDPDLAEAIHRCTTPVVAAIGHESDTTIAELVADHRAATPTQATVKLTPDREALAQQLASLTKRSSGALAHALQSARLRVESLASRPVLADPSGLIRIQRERLGSTSRRLAAASQRRMRLEADRTGSLRLRLERQRPHETLRRRRDRLASLARSLASATRGVLSGCRRDTEARAGVLHAVDPTAVLERGYSITSLEDGTLVRSPEHAPPGTAIVSRLAEGTLVSIAGTQEPRADAAEGQPGDSPSPAKAASTKPRTRRAPAGEGGDTPQLGLFQG